MKKFSDFGIKTEIANFDGDKLGMERILNRQITVLGFKIDKSKYPEKGNPWVLQLHIEINGNRHVVFSGSKILQETIKQIKKEDFPFQTTIEKNNRRFEFT